MAAQQQKTGSKIVMAACATLTRLLVSETRKAPQVQVLLVGHKGRGMWGVPGGAFDEKLDASLKDTAEREMLEETNLKVEVQPKHYCRLPTKDSKYMVHHFFVTKVLNDASVLGANSDADGIGWIGIDEILAHKFDRLPIIGDAYPVLKQAKALIESDAVKVPLVYVEAR